MRGRVDTFALLYCGDRRLCGRALIELAKGAKSVEAGRECPSILRDESTNHRPDVVARVFNIKRKALTTELTKRGIFGKINAFVCSIEWQKRGLPHAHILLWLAKEDEIRADSIDAIVSAEIPDKETNPHLHDVVIANMVHGPCGKMDPNCPCMKDGLCTKHYPKDFVPETMCSEDGYPLYRRRRPDDGGQTAKKTIRGNEVEVDNRWVVPYSPYLCHMFKCHINVEVCNSIKAIKYVIKYVNKGNDMAIFALQRNNPNDEIDVYQAARYVSCSEACWRLFEFSIHDRYLTVMNLQIHLPNGQRVLFTEENAATLAKDPPKTTLTACIFRPLLTLCQWQKCSKIIR